MALFIDSCLLWVTAVAAGFCIIPFVLLHAFKLPRYPKERARAFVKRSRTGPIAHRGGSPENTLAAFRRAKAEGASSVEVDLEFTRDGHPVLLHDSTVDRTSNGSGSVADMSLEEVKRLDFGSKYGSEFTGERIPTLYEAVDLCEELDLLMFLEMKRKTDQSAVAVQRLFAGRPNLYSRVAVISFWPRMLYKVRYASPDVICGLCVISELLVLHPDGSRRNKARWKHFLSPLCGRFIFWVLDTWLWKFLGIGILLPYKNDILSSRVDAKKWEERGVPVVTWTVNKREEKLYFRDVLKLPYLTDCCQVDHTVPEQIP